MRIVRLALLQQKVLNDDLNRDGANKTRLSKLVLNKYDRIEIIFFLNFLNKSE